MTFAVQNNLKSNTSQILNLNRFHLGRIKSGSAPCPGSFSCSPKKTKPLQYCYIDVIIRLDPRIKYGAGF